MESINQCNKYFSSIGGNLASIILDNYNETQQSLASQVRISSSNPGSFFLSPTDECEIESVINNFKSDSAPGLDGLNNRLIKEIKQFIIAPLTVICNLTFTTGVFPECWKIASVVPIHKAGRKDVFGNYRPISLLSSFSKILEKVMNKRLMLFLENNALLSSKQFGFRRGRSTEDAVSLLVDRVVSYLDKGLPCIGVFLDLAKAFDTVSLPILLRKLELFGIRGKALEWFSSYLCRRRQCVRVGSLVSDMENINFGVPQGSILGPTLFVLYINDLLLYDLPNTDVICYADDTALIFHDNSWDSVFRRAEQGLQEVHGWLKNNLLTLNVSKTRYLCFHKTAASAPQRDSTIKIHSCITSSVSSCSCSSILRATHLKYLGVIIDERLVFDQHIAATAARVRKLIYSMKLLRDIADVDVLKGIYSALCLPVLTYCLSVWGGAGSSRMIHLERAQRALLKVMFRRPFRYATHLLYNMAQVLTVRQLFIKRATLLVHKSILTSTNRSELLARRVYRIKPAITRTVFANRFSAFLHPYIYNKVSIPCNLKNLNLYEAKRKVHNWLLALTYDKTEDILKIIK